MKRAHIAFVAACLAVAGCGGEKSFRVEIDVPAIGTQEVTVVYTTADGDRSVIRVPAIDGRFEFEGRGGEQSTVELYRANKTLFAAFAVSDGEKVKLESEGDSLFVSGTDDFRPVVTAYADTVVSSWPEFVSQELIITRDSSHVYEPEGVWFFTSNSQERTHSVLDSIKAYVEADKIVRDVYVSTDLTQWRIITRPDSATWTQGLLPDGPLALDGILLFTPCLVEVDSAGVVSRVQRLE